jgi:hypothetical protein
MVFFFIILFMPTPTSIRQKDTNWWSNPTSSLKGWTQYYVAHVTDLSRFEE